MVNSWKLMFSDGINGSLTAINGGCHYQGMVNYMFLNVFNDVLMAFNGAVNRT